MRKLAYILSVIILFTACSGEIKEVVEKYPDGTAKVVVFFKKKDEAKIKIREIGYYQNKKEMYKGGFENGIRAGKWTYWYEDGKKFAETEISTSIATQQWEISKPDGTPYKETSYKTVVTEIYPNGSPYHVMYTKPTDAMVSELFFYPGYKLQMIGTSINNKREGKWNYWYENGNMWSEGYYKNGENDSIRNVWYENGQKRYEGLYRNAKEAGLWKFYEANGKLAKEVNYDTVGLIKKLKK
ncbi:MAG: hypothetical protein NTZ33_14300 [Bacteroidetes bacterium]|nr:hypothetical protein [Bacteroidota bacterium]